MPASTQNIDNLIQFALLCAGEQDSKFDKQLGVIHLIKYVYLADLYYAEKNNGQTFTGVEWKFHNFGPWSNTVNMRIEPALVAIRAEKQTFSSDYGDDDWARWSVDNHALLTNIKKGLPSCIKLRLPNQVKRYLKATPSLLDHVYKTPPMLAAAPSELLDFSESIIDVVEPETEVFQSAFDRLSNTKKKKFIAKRKELQQQLHTRKQTERIETDDDTEPYDEIYEQGVAWLDSLAGDAFAEQKLTANFSPEVWKSSTRKGDDVS